MLTIEKIEKLKEKLAEIEHQRWADWQKYVHSICKTVEFPKVPDLCEGDLIIPKALVEQWKRQIDTSYKNLTEEEKNSDRREVDKYFPLILDLLKEFGIELAGEFQKLIINEILIAQKEGKPTSRLTNLSMRLSELNILKELNK